MTTNLQKGIATGIATTLALTGIVIQTTRNMSDAEIQLYIQNALQNGCRPIIDICDTGCREEIILPTSTPQECIPEKIPKISLQRAYKNYFELGKKVGVDNILNVSDLPQEIRLKLSEKGDSVLPEKENLVLSQ